MKITFTCEHCGHQFAVDESLAGKQGRCQNCGKEMDVPSPEFRLQPLAEDVSDGSESEQRSSDQRQLRLPSTTIRIPVSTRRFSMAILPTEGGPPWVSSRIGRSGICAIG